MGENKRISDYGNGFLDAHEMFEIYQMSGLQRVPESLSIQRSSEMLKTGFISLH